MAYRLGMGWGEPVHLEVSCGAQGMPPPPAMPPTQPARTSGPEERRFCEEGRFDVSEGDF